ncbi:MAG: hypothetical protein GY850_35715, partial [bacterium]|nr:hypothetical protein [bacterium]
MSKYKTFLVRLAIILLGGFFILCQTACPPKRCTDLDSDGYGSPASTGCTHSELDCDDSDSSINPGIMEGIN